MAEVETLVSFIQDLTTIENSNTIPSYAPIDSFDFDLNISDDELQDDDLDIPREDPLDLKMRKLSTIAELPEEERTSIYRTAPSREESPRKSSWYNHQLGSLISNLSPTASNSSSVEFNISDLAVPSDRNTLENKIQNRKRVASSANIGSGLNEEESTTVLSILGDLMEQPWVIPTSPSGSSLSNISRIHSDHSLLGSLASDHDSDPGSPRPLNPYPEDDENYQLLPIRNPLLISDILANILTPIKLRSSTTNLHDPDTYFKAKSEPLGDLDGRESPVRWPIPWMDMSRYSQTSKTPLNRPIHHLPSSVTKREHSSITNPSDLPAIKLNISKDHQPLKQSQPRHSHAKLSSTRQNSDPFVSWPPIPTRSSSPGKFFLSQSDPLPEIFAGLSMDEYKGTMGKTKENSKIKPSKKREQYVDKEAKQKGENKRVSNPLSTKSFFSNHFRSSARSNSSSRHVFPPPHSKRLQTSTNSQSRKIQFTPTTMTLFYHVKRSGRGSSSDMTHFTISNLMSRNRAFVVLAPRGLEVFPCEGILRPHDAIRIAVWIDNNVSIQGLAESAGSIENIRRSYIEVVVEGLGESHVVVDLVGIRGSNKGDRRKQNKTENQSRGWRPEREKSRRSVKRTWDEDDWRMFASELLIQKEREKEKDRYDSDDSLSEEELRNGLQGLCYYGKEYLLPRASCGYCWRNM